MRRPPLVFQLQAQLLPILFGLLFIICGIVFTIVIYRSQVSFAEGQSGVGESVSPKKRFPEDSKSGGPGPQTFILLPILVGAGLLALIPGIRSILDTTPKLTVDETGINDHRTPLFIPWDKIQSMDCQISRGRAGLIIYHSKNGNVETSRIEIGDLEGGAQKVFTDIKAFRLQMEKQSAV